MEHSGLKLRDDRAEAIAAGLRRTQISSAYTLDEDVKVLPRGSALHGQPMTGFQPFAISRLLIHFTPRQRTTLQPALVSG
ncbi:hypothetical protein AXW85_29495 [Pseudomonas aeruginosa]|nr:hypothetical protein AXW85_29495 [Pseudomonas aeruginosa]